MTHLPRSMRRSPLEARSAAPLAFSARTGALVVPFARLDPASRVPDMRAEA